MTEYINKEQAIDTVAFYKNMYDPYPRVLESIANIPAADVVEQKHGEFVGQALETIWRVEMCSNCKEYVPVWFYCPNCGAKMDGGK